MCDRIGISGMYDFICLYNIAYIDASAEAERKKLCLSRRQCKDVNVVVCILHHLIWGKYSSFIIKFNCCFNLTSS